eukprot:TRINITY_DN2075_c0_g1_i3.p2 TRINITY_DN2075_c0_g1~~TRINITY_DN2075_c0_g1_i3.p2  ORF type:complete len:315 (+),score=26.59 TRINITY_DN2075_c0_g1_i3:326-1270(+)
MLLALLLLCLCLKLNCEEQSNICCHVHNAELQKFQHIRDMSHKFIIVIGTQKSGTTLTYDILARHPQTVKIRVKNLGTGAHHFDVYNEKFENYLDQFNLSALEEGYAMIEATPSYILSPGAACKIKEYLPNAKFIVLVKNPADRALSQFKMESFARMCNCKNNRICKPCGKPLPDFYTPIMQQIQNFQNRNCDLANKSWNECIGCYVSDRDMILRGFYAPQIQTWLHYFPTEQFLIINHQDTYQLQDTANRIYEFAGLEPFELQEVQGFSGMKFVQTENITRTLEILEDFYRPYNQQFYEMMENSFNVQNFSFH